MSLTLAFDIYGTLIDTAGIVDRLRQLMGDQAPLFSARWREKQLEYSFRRGLMKTYADFSVCTRDALNHTCMALQQPLSDAEKQPLLEAYRRLPAFPGTSEALQSLQAAGYRLYAFSNGLPSDLDELLENAALRDFFKDIVSVHEIKSFKPDPAVYRHFLERANAEASTSWLISSNPFDVLGSMASGMNAAWIKRDESSLFDPWGESPTVTIASLLELHATLEKRNG